MGGGRITQELWGRTGLWVEALHRGLVSGQRSYLFRESSLEGIYFVWAVGYKESACQGEGYVAGDLLRTLVCRWLVLLGLWGWGAWCLV